jgi:hypothetical protein
MHAATSAIVLYRLKSDDGNPHNLIRTVYASVVKNRDGLDRVGVSFNWHRPSGSFSEITIADLLNIKEEKEKKPVDAMKALRMVFNRDEPGEAVSVEDVLAVAPPDKVAEAKANIEAAKLILQETNNETRGND